MNDPILKQIHETLSSNYNTFFQSSIKNDIISYYEILSERTAITKYNKKLKLRELNIDLIENPEKINQIQEQISLIDSKIEIEDDDIPVNEMVMKTKQLGKQAIRLKISDNFFDVKNIKSSFDFINNEVQKIFVDYLEKLPTDSKGSSREFNDVYKEFLSFLKEVGTLDIQCMMSEHIDLLYGIREKENIDRIKKVINEAGNGSNNLKSFKLLDPSTIIFNYSNSGLLFYIIDVLCIENMDTTTFSRSKELIILYYLDTLNSDNIKKIKII